MSTARQSGAASETGPGGEVGPKMVKVTVEVRSGTARVRVGVRAECIREALSLVGGGYPEGEVAVVFPIEPDGFFERDPAARAGKVGTERAQREAA